MIQDSLLSSSLEELSRLRRENAQLRSRLETGPRDQQNGGYSVQSICNSLMNHVSDAVCTLTLEGAILEFNPSGLVAFGRTESVVGQSWSSLWSVASRPVVRRAIDQALSGSDASFSGDIPDGDGMDKKWDVLVSPIVNPFGKPELLVAIAREAQDGQDLQRSTNETDVHFRTLADNMAQLAWMADENGSVFWYNRRWFLYTGTTLEEMKGWGWRKVHHPVHIDRVVAKIRGAFASGQVWEDTFPLRHKDGKYRWFLSRAMPIRNAEGKVVRWFGTATDITRQLVTQSSLRASEDKLRLGIAVAGVAISEIDYANGTVELSQRAAEMYGLPSDQLVVQRDVLRNLIHPEEQSAICKLVDDALRGIAGGNIQCEHRIIRPCDGQVRWLRVNKKVFFEKDENGRNYPTTSLMAAHDITDQKNVQSEQERARQLAEQASRAKSDFLANMSHEIRTPMTAILGFADILGRHLNNPDNLNCVKTIRRNGLYLLDIINDILDLSKIEEGRLEVEHVGFSPVAIVEEIRSLMDVRAYEKRIPLRVDYQTNLPVTIKCDPTRLRQILVNLVANAIKFTERGSVQLAVRYLPETGKIEFSVIDSGIGISPEEVDRLFLPFTQADSSTTRRYGGSGLGLTISQRLARLMGGEIRVESELRHGSKFTLSINTGCDAPDLLVDPTIDVPVEQVLNDLQLGDAVELNCQVLVVDDRRDVRFLVQYIIEEAGGTVKLANNGQHALEIIKRVKNNEETPIDLVLMDLQMPKMGGLEATRRLRADGFDKPIIALTANAMKGDRETCLSAGCSNYLTKPIDKNLLLETIASHVGSSLARGFRLPKTRPARFCENRPDYRPGNRPEYRAAIPGDRGGSTRQEPKRRSIGGAARRILLVEDHSDAGRMLQQYLELDGHEVALVTCGSSAIERAASWLPQVIIMDLGLPDMSGLEVARQLRRDPELKNVCLIALTGRADESDRRESMGAGFNYHLVKPAEMAQLEKLIRNEPVTVV